jgi:hypothetical protein
VPLHHLFSQTYRLYKNVILLTEEEYKEEENLLEEFPTVNPISGTQKVYTFLPVRNGVLLAETFPTSPQSTEYKATSDLK